MPLQQGLFTSLAIRNDMLYSAMIDDTTPNLIAFFLATLQHLGGSNTQLQAVWDTHEPIQTPLSITIETDSPSEAWFGRPDLTDDFRTYYSRRLIAPGRSLQDNLVHELFGGSSTLPPLWMGLFALYGLPLVHLCDAMEAHAAVYAKHALALAASNFDHALAGVFTEIVCASARRAAPAADFESGLALSAAPSPLDILESLAYDGRLSNLPLDLPGYYDHGLYGDRHWSSIAAVRDVVLESAALWVFDDSDIAAALDELGRTAVVLAGGTHKPGDDAEFDFYLCFLATLVYSLRTVLAHLQAYSAVQCAAAGLVRCLWAVFVLVYILQLRPKMDVALLEHRHRGGGRRSSVDGSRLFDELCRDQPLALPKHQDPFYLRTLRSLVGLAAYERDPGWQVLIGNAAAKLRRRWHRWLGFRPNEGVTMNIRI